MNVKKFIHTIVVALSVAVFCMGGTVAYAIQLPDDAVVGLPEKLSIIDSEGNFVDSSSGEYCLRIDDIMPSTTYSKDLQIMNLLEDKAYHIYFYAEPISNSGNIDLKDECVLTLSLDGKQVYVGKVTGDGNIDLTTTPIDLGLYTSGESRTLHCEVLWNDSNDTYIDYGEKLVDIDGVHIVREGNTDYYSYGEVTFKWIFYASLDEDYVPPKTGILSSKLSPIYIAILSACAILIVVMLILIKRKKDKLSKGANV